MIVGTDLKLSKGGPPPYPTEVMVRLLFIQRVLGVFGQAHLLDRVFAAEGG